MEASKVSEVRRIHLVYFLSLMGRSQEPHLIRLHHLARNGVYLRDVKRWIGEVRGKDFAETYAWSYKRRYKTGYVWQDLLDDDLITPISDNEYVLKGSQIQPPSFGTLMFAEKKASIINEEIPVQVHDKEGKQLKQKQPLIPAEELQLERFPYFKTNSLYQLPLADNESEDCKVEMDKLGKHNHTNENSKTDTPETSFSISLSSSSSLSLSPLKGTSKRFSTGASGLIRNLITCGALDTNDDVTVMLDQAHKTVLSKNSITLDDDDDDDDDSAKIRKHDRFGGSARNLETCWNPHQHDADRKSGDEQSTNKNKKKLGEFLNQISHKPFGGSILSR